MLPETLLDDADIFLHQRRNPPLYHLLQQHNTPSYMPMTSLHVISDLTTLAFCWNLLLLVCFSIVTFLPSHLKKKRTSKSINNTNHDQTDNPQEYQQLIGSIDYSEKQKEHATIIARDIAYWTRETFDIDPEEDTAYYRTVHDATYPEAQAMIEEDD
jgi:hypothetical protein